MSENTRAVYPADLARQIESYLTQVGVTGLPLHALTEIVEAAYFASMLTEELGEIRCTLTYFEPEWEEEATSDEHLYRWCVSCLKPIKPLCARELRKMALAVDPLFSTFAVRWSPDNGAEIWGITDQALHWHRFQSRERHESPQHPGIFHLVINGVGAISVYDQYTLIARLAHGELATQFDKVLERGEIHERLRGFAQQIYPSIEYDLSEQTQYLRVSEEEIEETIGNCIFAIGTEYINAVSRILLRIQRYHHGGALLISPTMDMDGLEVRNQFHYDRLSHAITSQSVRRAVLVLAGRELVDALSDNEEDSRLSHMAYLKESQLRQDVEQGELEIDGCLATIASLSRVDGLVLLDDNLAVHGFGVFIRSSNLPSRQVFDEEPNDGTLSRIGTRHRTMMEYCGANKGCIGFVVSQDGDVSAMTVIGGDLKVWHNVELTYIPTITDQEVEARRQAGEGS